MATIIALFMRTDARSGEIPTHQIIMIDIIILKKKIAKNSPAIEQLTGIWFVSIRRIKKNDNVNAHLNSII